MLVPRGPVGQLDGKLLGCRALVRLHDAQAHPRLSTTQRGEHHVTMGRPPLLHCHEQALEQMRVQRVVVDREGMAAQFLAQHKLAGRQVVTFRRADQDEAERSVDQVGAWRAWRYTRTGQGICEVASARFPVPRPHPADPPVEVAVALIRDGRQLLPVAPVAEAAHGDGKTALAPHQAQFWEEGWQAVPAPPVPRTAKRIAVSSSGPKGDAVELAQTYFERWHCQETSLRDWLRPLPLDTNQGEAKEQVVNWELAPRQVKVHRRAQRLHQLAQACRAR